MIRIHCLLPSLATSALLISGIGSNSNAFGMEREVRIYSGRHYNTDRQVYKKFNEETGIKIRLIETTGISLIERLKREGRNSKADVILLVDAARISNAASSGLLQPFKSKQLEENVPIKYRDSKQKQPVV